MCTDLAMNLVIRRIVYQETRLLRPITKMKISLFFVFCLFFTIQYKSVDGGLVKNFFEETHKVVHQAREDVRDLLHLNKNKDDKAEKETTTQPNEPAATEATSKDVDPAATEATSKPTETKKDETAEEVEATPKAVEPAATESTSKPTETKKDEKAEEATTVATSTTVSTNSTDSSSVTTTVSPVEKTTPQEGRENFNAPCATGYARTADGRCKPKF